jgi:Na+-transporting NADH:ubiquinone oxidoreductase subunit NqrF
VELVERFAIEIEETGETYYCTAEQHLLAALAATGKKGIPSGCHGGGCGICKIEVLDGVYKTKRMSRDHISEEEEKEGFGLACRVFPKSDICLKVVGKLRKNVLKNGN